MIGYRHSQHDISSTASGRTRVKPVSTPPARWFARLVPLGLLMAAPAVAANALSDIKVQIDTVPARYSSPIQQTAVSEPVSVEDFRFEINRETLRTRIVVDYQYVGEVYFGADDGWINPRPTKVQLPGLRYDPQAHQIVYEKDGERTVCALVQDREGIFGQHYRVRNTGSCGVISQDTRHTDDDGWALHHYMALDVYFEVRPSQ